MDAEGLKELFAPFGPVTVRRMFGGAGIYADSDCAANASRKGDQASFATETAGSVSI